MNYSQKAARVFEIVDYILLLPAGFGVLVASLFVFAAPAFALMIWTIAGFGIWLLVGYFKHSRGRLSERKVSLLWLGTICYNSIPLLWVGFYVWKYIDWSIVRSLRDGNLGGGWFWLTLAVWWATAVFVPANALYKNYRQAEKFV